MSKTIPTKQQLSEKVQRQASRMRRSEEDTPTLLAQAVYTGSLGLLFVLPVVGGAYLGNWLDSLMQGYSMFWTLSLIIIGVILGAVNVYLFVREH